jgi:hypothetical protein
MITWLLVIRLTRTLSITISTTWAASTYCEKLFEDYTSPTTLLMHPLGACKPLTGFGKGMPSLT